MQFLRFLKSKTFFWQIGLALVLLLILVFLLFKWLKINTRHGETIDVPELTGKSVLESKMLIERARLRYEIIDTADFNPKYPRFSIVEQNPPAGNQVKKNRCIYLRINPAGYKDVSVPPIVRVTKRNAQSMLRAVGLKVGQVTYIDELGKDVVYYLKFQGRDILPGERVPRTSAIHLVCGNGKVSLEKEQAPTGDDQSSLEYTPDAAALDNLDYEQ